jgi:nucleolar pre-ribosomal-associated protein 1
VDSSSPSALKAAFLERHVDALRGIFKGLAADPSRVVRVVFERLWEGVWEDARLKRTLKIALFNEMAVAQVRACSSVALVRRTERHHRS